MSFEMRNVLVAVLATCCLTLPALADDKVRPLDDFSHESWNFSKAEQEQAILTAFHIMNARCISMTGKSIVGTPGFASYAIPKLMFASPHKLSQEKAIEIYDRIFDEWDRVAGDPRRASREAWEKSCADFRAGASPRIYNRLRFLGDR
jgi:hypothetical protein